VVNLAVHPMADDTCVQPVRPGGPLGLLAQGRPPVGRGRSPPTARCLLVGPYSPVRSTTGAVGAFTLTESIPFFAAALVV
jgi:hypothetical protein